MLFSPFDTPDRHPVPVIKEHWTSTANFQNWHLSKHQTQSIKGSIFVNTHLFYKHKAYKHIQAEIHFKNYLKYTPWPKNIPKNPNKYGRRVNTITV